MQILFSILLVIHFGYHLVASLGGAWTFWHSYKEHKKGKWKIVASIFWLAISILLLIVSDERLHNCK
jgi:drug/metabolite transporter superfamily protein YnfA